jgi:hypothetical protein
MRKQRYLQEPIEFRLHHALFITVETMKGRMWWFDSIDHICLTCPDVRTESRDLHDGWKWSPHA